MKKFCVQCGKEIVGLRAQAKFCSAECLHAFYRVLDNLPCTCVVCGKSFKKKHSNQKYCSGACSRSAATLRKKNTAHAKKSHLKCHFCGKIFEASSYGNFCSNKCKGAHRKQKIKSPPAQPEKTLAQWVDEARQCNLDYGTYRALIQAGKSFDELKTQAANHVGCHAHKGKGVQKI